ncbi:unnamed protein product [Ambrosiozyma monospora]|uniref:Unnamed protein product n=1 Tax=Ambrosiozyma monospora TaxID=43982 RepID=A0A9W7DKM3_AMBMO|nr:unnamed protein product [Ambrosiozyma monospora]
MGHITSNLGLKDTFQKARKLVLTQKEQYIQERQMQQVERVRKLGTKKKKNNNNSNSKPQGKMTPTTATTKHTTATDNNRIILYKIPTHISNNKLNTMKQKLAAMEINNNKLGVTGIAKLNTKPATPTRAIL